MARGEDKGGGQGPRPPYECEFPINFLKIQINFENLTLLASPNIQKINFLAPPLVMAPMLRLEIMNSSLFSASLIVRDFLFEIEKMLGAKLFGALHLATMLKSRKGLFPPSPFMWLLGNNLFSTS
jgi:hypothetical protein